MKSAFAEFEERMMPIVRDDNPRLKLSQYREIIFKLWLFLLLFASYAFARRTDETLS